MWSIGGKRMVTLTMPVDGSTLRDSVSTATTWFVDLFQGEYLSQFAVETSDHE